MALARVSAKGGVVIPAALRKRLGIKPGDRVTVSERDGEIVVQPAIEDPILGSFGLFPYDPNWEAEYLAEKAEDERRRDAELERLGQDRSVANSA